MTRIIDSSCRLGETVENEAVNQSYVEHYMARSAAQRLVSAGLDDEAAGILRRVCGEMDPSNEVARLRIELELSVQRGKGGFILPRRKLP